MNIWTGLLFLEGSLPDVELARSLTTDPAPLPEAAEVSPDREREAQAAQRAVPLWRRAPGAPLR